MARIILPHNGWVPRPDQMNLWRYLMNGGKRAVGVMHRRFGKDDIALHYTAIATQRRVGTYWHMLSEYGQARKAIWDGVNQRTGMRRIDEVFPAAMRSQTKSQEMMIKFKNGSTWQLVGSDTFNALVGSNPVGIVFSEYAVSNPMAWPYLRPILAENGGWALFIYTSRGDNHGKTLYYDAVESQLAGEDWFAERVTALQTPVFTPETLDKERREYQSQFGDEIGLALFKQEYLCDFQGAIVGSYYGKQISEAESEGRVSRLAYEMGHEIYTFWDLGVDDATSIWFMQLVGNEFHFIDYYENTGYGLDHYAQVLKDKRTHLKYNYGDHYMPHDAAAKSFQTGVSTKDYAEGLGIEPIIIVQRPHDSMAVLSGIQAGRKVFNRCHFDSRKCAAGLASLANYRASFDQKKKKLSNTPIHDYASHAADAFRTFATGYREISRPVSVGNIMKRVAAEIGGVM